MECKSFDSINQRCKLSITSGKNIRMTYIISVRINEKHVEQVHRPCFIELDAEKSLNLNYCTTLTLLLSNT